MARLGGGQVSGPGGSVAWQLRGPAALHQSPALTHSQWERQAQPGVQLLANVIRSEAQAAYSGTRFAPGFGYRTALQPTVQLTLFNRHALFAVVENPTKPHVIKPRNALYGWLVFQIGGRWVRAKSVNHPGTKGRAAIPPIFAKYESTFRRIVTTAMTTVLTQE